MCALGPKEVRKEAVVMKPADVTGRDNSMRYIYCRGNVHDASGLLAGVMASRSGGLGNAQAGARVQSRPTGGKRAARVESRRVRVAHQGRKRHQV